MINKFLSESWVGKSMTLLKQLWLPYASKWHVSPQYRRLQLLKKGKKKKTSLPTYLWGNESACKTRTWSRWLISPLHFRSQCLLICLSCLWQPWRLITFCGSLLWVVICTSRSASHMFFDYWRWCVRTLSAHCVVLSEVDTQVKAHNRSPTHANELIS